MNYFDNPATVTGATGDVKEYVRVSAMYGACGRSEGSTEGAGETMESVSAGEKIFEAKFSANFMQRAAVQVLVEVRPVCRLRR
jgi:hypothetical protein